MFVLVYLYVSFVDFLSLVVTYGRTKRRSVSPVYAVKKREIMTDKQVIWKRDIMHLFKFFYKIRCLNPFSAKGDLTRYKPWKWQNDKKSQLRRLPWSLAKNEFVHLCICVLRAILSLKRRCREVQDFDFFIEILVISDILASYLALNVLTQQCVDRQKYWSDKWPQVRSIPVTWALTVR